MYTEKGEFLVIEVGKSVPSISQSETRNVVLHDLNSKFLHVKATALSDRGCRVQEELSLSYRRGSRMSG